MSMRKLSLCLLLAGLAAPARAQTSWERYLTLPTSENAQAVQALAYSDSADAVDRLLADLDLLADQMNAGDTAAVRLAFRLLPHAEGVYGETLGTMVGRLVRNRPTLFLRELDRAQRQKDGVTVRREIGCALSRVIGPEYVDRQEAAKYEARQRIASLRAVSADNLRSLRNQCIAALEADIARGA